MEPSKLKFITNDAGNTVLNRLSEVLPKTEWFDCLVGYFFISGFFRVYPHLQNVSRIRILIGLKTDTANPTAIEAAEKALSHAETLSLLSKEIRYELGNSNDALEIENGVRCFVEWTKTGKLEIRVFPSHKIHAKIYIATPSTIARVQNVYHGTVITGSSNLTEAGLSENLEFNVQLTDPEDHDYALRRFEELWAQSVPVERTRETIIKIVEHDSPYASFTPYELYLKFLTEYFREELGRTTGSGTDCYPRGFKELKYQADAVDAAFSILKQYHGVFLADVVGLGKTYMAAMLALRLDGRCLVIAPPALLDRKNPGSWPNVFGDFLVRGYICESIGKLDALLKRDLSVFKYVFVDESHRFRTDDTIRYDQLAQICRGKGVILVSAKI